MLKCVPAICDRLRVVNLVLTHVTHCDYIPHLSVLLEGRDRDRGQVDSQNLLNNVDIQHVHL